MSLVGIPLVRPCNLPGCLIAVLLLVTCWGGSSQAQSDDAPEPTANEPSNAKPGFSNPLSKLFARKPPEESDEPTKPSRPSMSLKPGSTLFRNGRAKPTPNSAPNTPDTEARGGLLVPLKSFTNRVFRTSDETLDESSDSPATAAPPKPSPKNRIAHFANHSKTSLAPAFRTTETKAISNWKKSPSQNQRPAPPPFQPRLPWTCPLLS